MKGEGDAAKGATVAHYCAGSSREEQTKEDGRAEDNEGKEAAPDNSSEEEIPETMKRFLLLGPLALPVIATQMEHIGGRSHIELDRVAVTSIFRRRVCRLG